ncbi:Wzz/FepE/Etk N-terminal domain-containing protein [Haloechinothrix halophila]|uniref:Wzz/FepE/Etk N-terminal domain-containing protein n=1 Tax=Haloechinothrix halophila TaxID=1069073 RepID=UPI000426FCF0|nr:Wzz/FepE/Etk N-terminal domain-containing protein [Haloechinothrix halophila]
MTAQESTRPTPLLDLQQLVVTLRWRKRVWLSCALLGLIAGTLLAVFLPPPPTAVTRLLLVHENDQPTDSGTLMETDIALLDTVRIAEATLQRLGSDTDPAAFRKSYEAEGLTNNVVELTVTADSGENAEARAQALAETVIADHIRRAKENAEAEAQALRDRRKQAEEELARVDDAIAAAPDDTGQNPAALGSLYSRRAEIAAQVADLSRRATEASIGAPQVAVGTGIVDEPRLVERSAPMTLASYGGIGLVLGLAVGLALAAAASVVRDRPVLRRDIADNLGASVLAQVPMWRRGPARLLHGPRKAERARIAATLVRAVDDEDISPAPVSVLELGCAPTAAELAADTALALRRPVMLVDDLRKRQLTKLAGRGGDTVRIVSGADYLSGAVQPGQREQCLGVGSVAPGATWTDLAALGTQTVLVVRAGHATSEWLHTVARQLAAAGVAVIGVVLVEPYPKDRTDGTLWDGVHTALRGRLRAAERTALPHDPNPSTNGRTPARAPEDVEV